MVLKTGTHRSFGSVGLPGSVPLGTMGVIVSQPEFFYLGNTFNSIELISSFLFFINKKKVGWGKSEFSGGNQLEDVPRKLDMPIIDVTTCLTTDSQLARISSTRTFCAGYQNQAKGPCIGDAGAGFYLKSGENWVIKGIVAASLIDIANGCNVNKFSIYTNIDKYTDWIRATVDNATREEINSYRISTRENQNKIASQKASNQFPKTY